MRGAPPLTILGPNLNGQGGSAPVLYAFDTAGRAQHDQELVITKNPVQTGAAIGDHSYLQPAQLSAEIWMSDLMQSYVLGQFTGAPSRSVSAYQTLKALQRSSQFLQIATRLDLYNNMLIRSISASDTIDTRYGLVVNVVFEEVILANQTELTSSSVSFQQAETPDDAARFQTIGNTQSGQTQTSAVPSTIVSQHSIANAPEGSNLEAGSTVPNSGVFSSTNVNTLSQVLP